MILLSSDTNIWLDFARLECLEEPFLLKEECKYLMSADALSDELTSPPGISKRLLELGIEVVEINDAEYRMTMDYGEKYRRLSVYDRFAISIAKVRKIMLLTGDGALRSAAEKEGVKVHGTLWILDILHEKSFITARRYKEILLKIQEYNGGFIRLPEKEIEKRLKRLFKK